MLRPGPTNSLADVAGIRVGHCTRDEPGWLTGVTVILPPAGGAVAGVDVRGGGPGTRETDLLDPRNLVDRVDAIVLAGGSAFGLAAADGVMAALYAEGRGWPVGGPGDVVPIVPAAICFDLGRGGAFGHHPGPDDGRRAYRAAGAGVPQGCVGAGTGAKAGGLKGGVGTASAVLPDGTVVAALLVVNPVGSTVDPRTGVLYASTWGLAGEFADLPVPSPEAVAAAAARDAESGDPASVGAGMATTIGVIATDARLTKAQCQKMAGVGHDGMARAIVPVHSMFDGDTVFALSCGERAPADPMAFHELLAAAASCVTRAIGHAMLAAVSVDRRADAGVALRSWRDALGETAAR